jgi:hypothetical protein
LIDFSNLLKSPDFHWPGIDILLIFVPMPDPHKPSVAPADARRSSVFIPFICG